MGSTGTWTLFFYQLGCVMGTALTSLTSSTSALPAVVTPFQAKSTSSLMGRQSRSFDPTTCGFIRGVESAYIQCLIVRFLYPRAPVSPEIVTWLKKKK